MERASRPSAISPTAAGPQPRVEAQHDKVTATLPTGDSVEILLYGATVLSWKSNGHENLFLSEAAKLDGSKPVRGGIPVVFPVFGPGQADHNTGKLPQHGFARNSTWEYLGKSSSESSVSGKGGDDSITLDFGLSQSYLTDAFKQAWPYTFALVYSITLKRGSLQTMLNVRNSGEESFEFQMLLHSYFTVAVSMCGAARAVTDWLQQDITKTEIKGLGSVTYIDKMLDASEQHQTDPVIRIAGEVDRVYKSIKQDTTSVLVGGQPALDVIRDNINDTVVWNPWIEKTKATGDLRPESCYKTFVCVEVGSVDGWQKLEPGDVFEGGQILKSHL